MKLYFEDSEGKRKFLNQVSDIKEANKIIYQLLKEYNFTSYYTRTWYENKKKEIYFDVGSWSEFFVITDVEKDPYKGDY